MNTENNISSFFILMNRHSNTVILNLAKILDIVNEFHTIPKTFVGNKLTHFFEKMNALNFCD